MKDFKVSKLRFEIESLPPTPKTGKDCRLIILSPDLSPAISAGDLGETETTVKCTFESLAPVGTLLTDVGSPDMNPIENKIHANKKFINTPAKRTIACFHFALLTKLLSLSGPFVFSSSGSSPKIFTNPPMGKRLRLYSVSPYFLPNNFGGKPKPNSSTRMPNFFAVKKCPNSWTRTSTNKIIMNIIMLIQF